MSAESIDRRAEGLKEQARTLLAGLRNTLPVVRVDDEDDALGVLEVCGIGARVRRSVLVLKKTADKRSEGGRTVPPEGANLVLSSNIPDGERDVLVLDSLDVEA